MAHLVFQTAFPGDLFLSIPLIRRIREWDPHAQLVLACRPGLGEFFLKNNLVDEVLEIDKKSTDGQAKALAQLSAREWDVVFVPHESVRTALWMWKLRAQTKVGFYKWWNFPFFNKRVKKPMEFPDALRQLSLLTPLDAKLAEDFASPEFAELESPEGQNSPEDLRHPRIPAWAAMQLHEQRDPNSKRVFLAPGSVWDTKRWTIYGYTELARILVDKGYQVELVGSHAERALCEEIKQKVPAVLNRAGLTTFQSLYEMFGEGLALICNDSGAMHVAAAAGLPTVAVFGPTVLAQGFRPWQNRSVVVQKSLSCRPCGKHGAKVCPIGTHECMQAISAGEVFQAFERLVPTI